MSRESSSFSNQYYVREPVAKMDVIIVTIVIIIVIDIAIVIVIDVATCSLFS